MKIKYLATGMVGLLLAGMAAWGFWGWHSERNRVLELEARVDQLESQEKLSAIDRNVSKQMEEIAYQQKSISDEQREEAILQRGIADSQRHVAEKERQNALEAEHIAREKEQEAKTLQGVAEHQRQLAEQQRMQAEYSKRQADTLSYLALGRSLGSFSSVQRQSGNDEIATLLAYASYLFTSRYGGDVYNPAVLQALMSASQGQQSWGIHNGAVMGVDFLPTSSSNDVLFSVSTYGEIFRHKKQGNDLKTTKLFGDSRYDFRYVYVDEAETVYAVSHTGQLVVISDKGTVVKPLPGLAKPSSILLVDDKTIAVAGENALSFIDKATCEQTAERSFDFKITTSSRWNNHAVLFDNQGYMHEVISANEIKRSKLPSGVKGTITAFANSKNAKADAYGTSDGKIFVVQAGQPLKELVGHRSRISRLKFNGKRLYSSSYDGAVNLWMYANEKVEPMLLSQSGGWVMFFTNDNSKDYIWYGDQKGNLSETLVSVSRMVEKTKSRLKRNFTKEEWNSYIGTNVPYERFIERKEVRP